jgi:hypothetical protein
MIVVIMSVLNVNVHTIRTSSLWSSEVAEAVGEESMVATPTIFF